MNISGGSVGSGFDAFSGSTVDISGGSFDRDFNAFSGSDVELIGGEFRLNGTDFSGSTFTLQTGDVFTGILQDGSAFIFTQLAGDQLNNVLLTSAALPGIGLTPVVVNADNPNGPNSLRAGQTLALQDGGTLGADIHFQAVGATLNIEGGTLHDFTEVSESTVNISGGSVGSSFECFFQHREHPWRKRWSWL